MVQSGMGGLDTPRTNAGDATYLSRQPDFDISQELSFQSPSKDANVLQQLRDGGRPNLRTPRGGTRAPFADRRNLPAGLGGAEFTPLLKSATRNSAKRYGTGKENGIATPAFLGRIDEDMTPMPVGESSVYGASRNTSSYMDNTPLPTVENSSAASTPLVMRRRDGRGPLEEGNQLSLREQENVIDRIEKENFGLKLKIHFLEEALRKAGPGFSEAALKENTELKVDQVTMQRELQRYKKHLTSAEKDLESYRQQILEIQEKAKRKFADENQRAEMERLNRALQDREVEIEGLQRQIERNQAEHDNVEKLQDDIGDLESDMRRKDHLIGEYEDELEELRAKVHTADAEMKDAQRRVVELEEKSQASDELEEARAVIEDLESSVRHLEQKVDDMSDKLQDATADKDRAEADLDELQDEMANKSVVTKGLSRQLEEKTARLQNELDKARQAYSSLQDQHLPQQKENEELKVQVGELRQERDSSDRIRQSLATNLEEAQADLRSAADEIALLQTRHNALTGESASLQREVSKLQKSISELEENLEQERQHSLDIERDVRNQYKDEIDRLNDEISELQAECRAKDNLYDNDSEKWTAERHGLESERDFAEERASGLQNTIDKLQEAKGSLSNKELKLQEAMQSETERHKNEEAVLGRQIDDLQQSLESRQALLEDLRNELSAVRDELRQSQLDFRAQEEKGEALEDEVEVLQATMDEESEKARQELEQAQRQRSILQEQLASLQSNIQQQQPSENADLVSARHTIRELERRVEAYEIQLATSQTLEQGGDGEGNSELSLLHRDLSAARAKELESLQREATQRDAIKTLKRQIAELERKIHDAELDRLIVSPSSHGGSAQKSEISELRHQLSSAQKSIHELRKSLLDADGKAAAAAAELQARLEELEDQNALIEQALEDAQAAASEASVTYESTLKKYKRRIEKYKEDREEQAAKVRELQQGNHTGTSDMSVEERRDLHAMLRESQTEADRLDREVREQREALDELMAVEVDLRKKLERARSERAAYRASAEKLQKDIKALSAAANDRSLVRVSQGAGLTSLHDEGVDTEAIIRGVEAAEHRHDKEIRGMVLHMEWLKACWDREAMFRSDGMFVKQYLLEEVKIRDACNKADLAIINRIRSEINPRVRPAMNQLSWARTEKNALSKTAKKGPFRLKHFLTVVRFVVRCQISARNWAKHEALRQRLADAYDHQEREQRIRKMRDDWRAEMQQRRAISAAKASGPGIGYA